MSLVQLIVKTMENVFAKHLSLAQHVTNVRNLMLVFPNVIIMMKKNMIINLNAHKKGKNKNVSKELLFCVKCKFK